MDTLRTSGGVLLTDDLMARLAEEAERGYDVDRLRPHPHRDPPPEHPPTAETGPRAAG